MNLNNFFQELKRRNVLRVASIYAVASWLIIQVCATIFPEFNMPEGSVRVVILLCLIGFPIALALAWGFELVSDGGSDEKTDEQKAGWIRTRQRSSLITSIVVVVLGVIGFGLFFYNIDLAAATTNTVEIENEEGEMVTRSIPKMEFTNKFVVFPYQNKQSDQPEKEWLKVGIPFLVDKDLEQDPRLFSTQSFSLKADYEEYNYPFLSELPFAVQLKIAKDRYTDYFITGSFRETQDSFILDSKVFDTERGEVFYEGTVAGKDLYDATDKLTAELTKNLYLESARTGSNGMIDLPASNLVSPNLAAYQTYINGELITTNNVTQAPQAISLLRKSIELDPNCAECYAKLGQLGMASADQQLLRDGFQNALDLSTVLPERQQFMIKMHYYQAFDEIDNSIRLLENWRKLYPSDYYPYTILIDYYRQTLEWDKSKEIAITAIENGHKGTMLLKLANLYADTEDFEGAEKYYSEFSKLYPHKTKKLVQLGELYIKKGELEKAKDYFEQLLLIEPTDPLLLINLAKSEEVLGNFDVALKGYEKALGNSKTIEDSVQVLTKMEEYYYRFGKVTKSIELADQRFKVLSSKYPQSVLKQQRVTSLASKLIESGRGEEFLREMEELKDMFPQTASFFDCFGNFIYQLLTENAVEFEIAYNECVDILVQFAGPNYKTLSLASLYRLEGSSEKAIQEYQKYIEETGFSMKQFGYEMSALHRNAGKVGEAIQLLDNLLLSDPHQPLFLLEQARNYKEKGDMEMANSLIDEVMTIFKEADENYKGYIEAKAFHQELESSNI